GIPTRTIAVYTSSEVQGRFEYQPRVSAISALGGESPKTVIARITAETVIRNVIIASFLPACRSQAGVWLRDSKRSQSPIPIRSKTLLLISGGGGRKNRTENCFGLACREYPLAPAMLTRVRQLTAPLRSRLCNWL